MGSSETRQSPEKGGTHEDPVPRFVAWEEMSPAGTAGEANDPVIPEPKLSEGQSAGWRGTQGQPRAEARGQE